MLISGTEQNYNPHLLPPHPGENDSGSDYKRIHRRFEDYLYFVNETGMTERERQIMANHMEAQYLYTRSFWEPKRCHTCAEEIFKLYKHNLIKTPKGYKAVLISSSIDHSWFGLINEETNKALTFDPTGLDREDIYEEISQRYVPFFGIAEYAPSPLREIYLGKVDASYGHRLIYSTRDVSDPAHENIYSLNDPISSFQKRTEKYKPIMRKLR